VTRATPLTAFRNAGPALDIGANAAACRTNPASEIPAILNLSIHNGLDAVEAEWRRFEQVADCTPFQTFDWLATWQRHIGLRDGVRPVIAVGSFADRATAFMLPLAVEPQRAARRLCWLGQDLSDYNAPLLARDFSQRVTPDRFRAAWRELEGRMQCDPMLRHDWIDLEKMPQTIGGQINPFTYLDVSANASGAHLTQLGSDWEKFYFARRSSATRRHDRAKRRHLSEFGEIRFVNSANLDDARCMVETLMHQKSRSLARKGIANVLARRGCREFFLDLASNLPPPYPPPQAGEDSFIFPPPQAGEGSLIFPPPQAGEDSFIFPPPQAGEGRVGVHISRVEIGAVWAAVNFGIVFGDCYYHVLASHEDNELSHYGPGALHLRELLAYAIGRGLRRFDFTIGDEPYKLEWSDTHLKLCDYTKVVSWRGWSACCRSMALRRLKRFIKQTPWAWRMVPFVRSVVGPL